ncbi:YbhB/YbcL family Raf kinase inhibitor-like protein [Lactobacillus sp. DCY120]|uniref:YbhB/YbcL family Raf kinase inhibitor-like protein n=1 Tax=Bombilactobacillus apium TaxID=2675299 RepID=A0A850QZ86_9LACO|nr:YbhB/YbcL family Raf kinase inhibitor-like protein [Bombilactobacillus apium]NVY96079.1 YbhB/YbcL family Raf kinase inhibitor-like protein [Bombilactobacillus apium]
MHVTVPLVDGQLAAIYGKYAPSEYQIAAHPVRSFPLEVTELPKATQTWALVLLDFDSTPVCGFPWIHWSVANLSPKQTQLPANASRDLDLIQAKNSNAGPLVAGDPQIQIGYVGPQPPDQTHNYTLFVYALDIKLTLTNGYWLNEFYRQMQGHILDQSKIELPSPA